MAEPLCQSSSHKGAALASSAHQRLARGDSHVPWALPLTHSEHAIVYLWTHGVTRGTLNDAVDAVNREFDALPADMRAGFMRASAS